MYERKVWVNRQSEHPARRKLTPTGNDGEYDVSRSEGIIMEDGDAFDADTMNDLERRVAAGFTELDPTGAGGGEVTVQPYTCEKKERRICAGRQRRGRPVQDSRVLGGRRQLHGQRRSGSGLLWRRRSGRRHYRQGQMGVVFLRRDAAKF